MKDTPKRRAGRVSRRSSTAAANAEDRPFYYAFVFYTSRAPSSADTQIRAGLPSFFAPSPRKIPPPSHSSGLSLSIGLNPHLVYSLSLLPPTMRILLVSNYLDSFEGRPAVSYLCGSSDRRTSHCTDSAYRASIASAGFRNGALECHLACLCVPTAKDLGHHERLCLSPSHLHPFPQTRFNLNLPPPEIECITVAHRRVTSPARTNALDDNI